MNGLFEKRIKDNKGQSTVEFALVLPILLLIIFGIIEFGFIFNAYVTVVSSAREGARYGIIGDKDDDEIIERVKNTAGALDTNPPKFNVEVDKSTDQLTVRVKYEVDILDPIMSAILGQSVPVKAEITMAME